MAMHELKTWPDAFQAVWDRKKLFEYRKDDRGFAIDDDLLLLEWSPETGEYSGRAIAATVQYLAKGRFDIPDSYVVMGIPGTTNIAHFPAEFSTDGQP